VSQRDEARTRVAPLRMYSTSCSELLLLAAPPYRYLHRPEDAPMTPTTARVVRAWKDADYRDRLASEERAAMPDHPAGISPLSNAEIAEVVGGSSCHCLTFGCCDGFTSDPGYCSLGLCPTGLNTQCTNDPAGVCS
jgi:mersacidin/lichenicidin family type 2 lantibiotic